MPVHGNFSYAINIKYLMNTISVDVSAAICAIKSMIYICKAYYSVTKILKVQTSLWFYQRYFDIGNYLSLRIIAILKKKTNLFIFVCNL